MVQEKGYITVGINVTYCAQLPFALYIGRKIREAFPEMMILYGGTEVSDVWKYLSDRSKFFDIFDASDACVIGEGEAAFTSLLEMIEVDSKFSPISNTVFHPKYNLSVPDQLIQYQSLQDTPTPDFSKLNWNLYLSPHPYIYYSPSRGCYWNKCTFCDYGLNFDSPTSPWRQRPLEKIIEDLRELSKQFKHIYFSVDVLAPAMLLQLAERLVEEKIDIRWGAEIRLEQYWSLERCQLLKASGCTDISVGFESGNQRILNLINKGTQVTRIQETIQNFHDAGIGVQVMGFTGFPTESLEDGLESVRFLHEHLDSWTFGGLGTFVLTPGAIVAKEPSRFDIYNVTPYQGEDIVRQLYYDNPTGLSESDKKIVEEEKKKLVKNHFARPWVGGIDTGHTMFYHDRYGRQVVSIIHKDEQIKDTQARYRLNGVIAADLISFPVHCLFREGDLDQLHEQFNREQKGLHHHEIKNLLAERVVKRAETSIERRRYFIKNDGNVYPFPEAMIDFLSFFANGSTLSNLLEAVTEEERTFYAELWEFSISKHFIRQMQDKNEQPHVERERTCVSG
ncbi:B12-binding domain-containing radical SAM protein [Tumebacillus avium]|nr:B12-binding domain-containing radical SAM protein [Tumebacillus avium]